MMKQENGERRKKHLKERIRKKDKLSDTKMKRKKLQKEECLVKKKKN